MGPTKVKKENLRTQYTQNVTEKLKEFKTWVQVKSPKPFQPALSYALDWLAPELLGTGFRMYEISDLEMKAVVPAHKSNFDSQFEIHHGLVTNSIFELAKVFIQRQMADHFFQIVGSELKLNKKQKWTENLNIVLKTSQSDLDDFFVDLQKNKMAAIEFKFEISKGAKKQDSAFLKLQIETTDLIA